MLPSTYELLSGYTPPKPPQKAIKVVKLEEEDKPKQKRQALILRYNSHKLNAHKPCAKGCGRPRHVSKSGNSYTSLCLSCLKIADNAYKERKKLKGVKK